MNRLKDETSPYLLQHADNPVDWYPWCDEAFEIAKREDKPILLSVGYSACHWCHVMAHESFEHQPTADIMNRFFVNIKVDREERTDVDAIYMSAVQALTRSGGWPMTVFLLPDGRPFHGGTYFPREPRHGMPSFRQVMQVVYDAYINRRAEIEQLAGNLTNALNRNLFTVSGDDASGLDAAMLNDAAAGIGRNFDGEHGGFGGAPKFPNPMNLEFLLRSYTRTGDQKVLDMVTFTLKKMARGGIYDQIGGGFHRYSVDAVWLVPHFEKMLYDNAQLSRLYLHVWQITGDSFFRQIAESIYDYILREMTSSSGGFYSTTDADSEGEEGKFFVWDKAELESLLGDDAKIAIEYWGVSESGNFEGQNILHVSNGDEVVAERLGISVEELRAKLSEIRDRLYAVRTQRIPPGLDDKMLTSWNGMMLASLAEAARVLGRDDYLDVAERTGTFLLQKLVNAEGRLYHTHKDGVSKINGYLEDYASLIDALLELYQSTFTERWFTEARRLADVVLKHFRSDEGGFFDTSDDHEKLIVRPRNVQDNATPSGNSLMARQLLRLSAYTGDASYYDAAQGVLTPLGEAMRQFPQAFGEALNAVDMLVNGVSEVAIVGDIGDAKTIELLRVVYETYRPNIIVALAQEDVEDESVIPLLSHRTRRGDKPTVYVCRNFACAHPVNTADEVEKLLNSQ